MSITLNTKVYDYQGLTPGNATLYKETSAGVPAGFSLLTSKVGTIGQGKTKKEQVKWYLKLPKVATESGPCVCVGEELGAPDTIEIVYNCDPSRDTATRTDARLRLADLVAKPEFISSFTTLKQPTT